MPNTFLVQPFKLGSHGGAAATEDADRHLRDKVLAILFTAPGERLNRPRFGVGLNRALFEGLNDLTIGAVEFRIAEGLRRDLGDEALVDSVEVRSEPESGQLLVQIAYRRRSDRAPRNLEIAL